VDRQYIAISTQWPVMTAFHGSRRNRGRQTTHYLSNPREIGLPCQYKVPICGWNFRCH